VKNILLCLLLLCSFARAKSPRDRAIEEVAKAERDFAKMSVAEGTRPAFFANFSDNGLSFGPQPTPMRELFGPAPPAGTPRTAMLDWYPSWTDASASGDFAFSTGPSVTSDKATGKALRWGDFASVWRKQSDGSWKVVLDIGIQHAEPPTRDKWSSGQRPGFKGKALDVSAEAEKLKDFDRSFTSGLPNLQSYEKVLSNESRLLRQGLFPIVGQRAILQHFSKLPDLKTVFQPLGADVAASGDFAYTYGAFQEQPGDKSGYYAHFWKRAANGQWFLVIDVTNLEDKEK